MTYDERIEQLRETAKDRAYNALHDMALYESLIGPIMQRVDEATLRGFPTPESVYFDEHPYRASYETEQPLPTVTFEVWAPVDESLPWRKRMAPMAAFFAAIGIKTRERKVSEYSGAVSYSGTVVRNGWKYNVTYNCGRGGLQPSCELVKEEVTETVTRTRYKTVCD